MSMTALGEPTIMSPTHWSEDAESRLKARGISLTAFDAPNSALSFRHPQNWSVDFREDHAICKGGASAGSVLIVYPIPNPEGGKGEGLLIAFLDEFVAPGVQSLNIRRLGLLPGEEGIVGAQFDLTLGGHPNKGIALMAPINKTPVIVTHWSQETSFNREESTDLLKATLGSVAFPESSHLVSLAPEASS